MRDPCRPALSGPYYKGRNIPPAYARFTRQDSRRKEMPLFAKRITAEDLGEVIYAFIHQGFLPGGSWSYEELGRSLSETPGGLPSGYASEILMGLLCASMLAVEVTY